MTESEEPDDAPTGSVGDGLLAALDGAEIGIFVLGPDFTVEWLNGTAERYFGVDRADVLGTDKQALIESRIKGIFEEPDRFAETVADTYADNSYIEEFTCHVLPGEGREERWLRHRSKPIETGPYAGGRVEHYTDISEQTAYERSLERQNRRLEEFASVVSHDLRNPLMVVEGRLTLIEGNDEHVADALDALERSQALIDDLLRLAREGRDVGEREPVDPGELASACWENVQTHAATLRTETGRRLSADRSRLEQLVENLLRNAVDHGGRDVTVTVGTLPEGFYVEDDGVGIPESDREAVFDVGHSTTEGGTGFGLAIVAGIVDAHGWEIAVTPSEGGGARFEITGVEFVE